MNNLAKINLDNYKPLRDVVFENLRTAILDGNLKAGQRLFLRCNKTKFCIKK